MMSSFNKFFTYQNPKTSILHVLTLLLLKTFNTNSQYTFTHYYLIKGKRENK